MVASAATPTLDLGSVVPTRPECIDEAGGGKDQIVPAKTLSEVGRCKLLTLA